MRGASPVRWLREHPFAADTLLAALVTAILVPASIFASTKQGDVVFRHHNAFSIGLSALGAVPIAWRRRSPLAVLVVAGAAAVVYEACGFPDGPNAVPVLIALYSVAAHCDRRQSIVGAVYAGVGVLVVFATARWHLDAGTVISNTIIFGTAWILGDNLRNRRAYVSELEAKADYLEREQTARAQQAVADERSRIARELHDVVAHNVSVMVVQAGAARRTIDRDTDGARDALTSVEQTGRQALDEMRRLLGVLRTDDEATEARAPQPSVADLDSLVANVRDAGLPVELVVEGVPRPLASGVDMSAYRIVQEALTNSLKHAGPARAHVRVRYGDHDLCVEVVDDGRGGAADPTVNGGGNGLVGMRERVALYGGELRAGPRAGGGYLVSARLPLEPSR
jgi:signal transduction histidine kinase